MKRVDPKWDGTSEPDCSDSVAPVVGDAITAGLLLGIGSIAGDKSIAANNSGNPDNAADAVAITGLLGGLVFAVSAAIGEHNYKECDNAMAAWRLGGAIGGGTEERTRRELKKYEREHKAHLAKEPDDDDEGDDDRKARPNPRGYFCASSVEQPPAGFCVREKAECRTSRDAASVAVPDLSECALQEHAWCTDDTCLPSADACEARLQKMGSGAADCLKAE